MIDEEEAPEVPARLASGHFQSLETAEGRTAMRTAFRPIPPTPEHGRSGAEL